MASKLIFIVPGLLDPVPYLEQLPEQELPELPLFNKILSRGHLTGSAQENSKPDHFYSTIVSQLTDSQPSDIPLASILYLSEKQKINEPISNKWLMRVDPCVMVPDRDQLLLKSIYNNDLDQTEAQQMVAEINNYYRDIEDEFQWHLYALAPEHWYLVCEQSIDINTIVPEKALNKPVKNFLPDGKGSAYWVNLLNEFQMILHQSKVNQARIKQGKAAINSVWLWGNGLFNPTLIKVNPSEQSEQTGLNKQQLYSDLDFVKGLANYFNINSLPFPQHLNQLDFNEPANAVFVDRNFIDAIEQRDLFHWLELIKQFESNYLTEITDLLRKDIIKQCELVSPSGRRLLITKRLLSRWWRRKVRYQRFLTA